MSACLDHAASKTAALLPARLGGRPAWEAGGEPWVDSRYPEEAHLAHARPTPPPHPPSHHHAPPHCHLPTHTRLSGDILCLPGAGGANLTCVGGSDFLTRQFHARAASPRGRVWDPQTRWTRYACALLKARLPLSLARRLRALPEHLCCRHVKRQHASVQHLLNGRGVPAPLAARFIRSPGHSITPHRRGAGERCLQ